MMGIAFLVTCLSYSYFCIVCIIIVFSRRNKYTITTIAEERTKTSCSIMEIFAKIDV